MEDNKQLILEGQHHVVVRTVGKEACSHSQKQVRTAVGSCRDDFMYAHRCSSLMRMISLCFTSHPLCLCRPCSETGESSMALAGLRVQSLFWCLVRSERHAS